MISIALIFGAPDTVPAGKPDSSDLRMDIGTNYFFASSTYIVHEIDGADAGTGNDSTRNPEFTTNDLNDLFEDSLNQAPVGVRNETQDCE